MDDVEGRVRELVSMHLDLEPSRLVPGARLGEDLCIDSLTAVELVMVLEDEFDIALPEEEVDDVRTYGQLLAVVNEQVGPLDDGN